MSECTPEVTDQMDNRQSQVQQHCSASVITKGHALNLRGGQAEAGLMGGLPSCPIPLDSGVQGVRQLMLECAP